jgi:Asp-tRNA(Asn)/Glu-tRNA(Gln) amidotransferase A subunit family amidase
MTRTVADCAALMAVLVRPDWRDATSLPPADIDWMQLGRELRGLRLGLLLDAGWGLAVEPETRAAVAAAARAFEAAGAIVEPLAPFMTRAMADGMDDFWRMRSWLEISALPVERQARVLPFIRRWVARAETLTGPQVFRGFSQMGALRDAAVAATQRFDFVLSPVSPDVAFAAELAMPSNDPERPFEHIGFTLPLNMSEQPAIAVPAGHDPSGLPIGLQIAGHRHDDLGVLRIARAWERLRGPQRDFPALA